MEQEERKRLRKALMNAEFAFLEALEKEGYHMEYGGDLMKNRGAIVDDRKSICENRIVGYVTISKEL